MVDEAQSDYKTKHRAAASVHIHDFMDTISHQPSKWEYLEHSHMTHIFWGIFGTYMGQHAKNKTMLKFPRGNKTASKKGVMSSKVESTVTSTKDVSQICLSDESDILFTTFVPA